MRRNHQGEETNDGTSTATSSLTTSPLANPMPSTLLDRVFISSILMRDGQDEIITKFSFDHQKNCLLAIVRQEFSVVLPPIRNENQVAISQADRLQMLLKNRLLKPVIKKETKQITFVTGPRIESWGISKTYPLSYGHHLVRSNGTISVSVGDTVKTLDIHSGTWSNQSFSNITNGNCISSIAESPDGLLIVGDANGVIHTSEKDTIQLNKEGIDRIQFINPNQAIIGQENHISLVSLQSKNKTGQWKGTGDFFCLSNGNILIRDTSNSSLYILKDVDLEQGRIELEFIEKDIEVQYAHDSSLFIFRKKLTSLWTFTGGARHVELPLGEIPRKNLRSVDNNRVVFNMKSQGGMIVLRSDGVHTKIAPNKNSDFPTCSTILSDGSIIYTTSSNPMAGIHHIQSIEITSSSVKNHKISKLEETVDGLVVGFGENSIVIFEPVIQDLDKNDDFKIEELYLKLKYDFSQLNLYNVIAAIIIKNNGNPYNTYIQGMESAMKLNKVYETRRFYEKAQRYTEDHSQRVKTAIKFYQYLKSTPYKHQRRAIALELFNLTKEDKYLEEFKNCKYKSRLLIGEGNFSYTKSLLEKHPQLVDLGKSITSTEFNTNINLEYHIAELQEKGVKILSGIDGQTIGTNFKGSQWQRIQWNCPFGGPTDKQRKEFKQVIPTFFQSASCLQKVGDRIHISLDQTDSFMVQRQVENPIVHGSMKSNYKLIRKRRFGERYSHYTHKMTNRDKSFITDTTAIREFVFEKVNNLDDCLPNQKEYTIKFNDKPGDYENAYFSCSTDDDSSDYCKSD